MNIIDNNPKITIYRAGTFVQDIPVCDYGRIKLMLKKAIEGVIHVCTYVIKPP